MTIELLLNGIASAVVLVLVVFIAYVICFVLFDGLRAATREDLKEFGTEFSFFVAVAVCLWAIGRVWGLLT